LGADKWRGFGADQPHPAVVRIVVSEGHIMSLGSGSLVAVQGRHGLVVTNWHVVRDARGPINVIFPDGFRSGASVLATDADWDLAALAIWRPNVEPLRISQRPPQPNEALSIAGYGSGQYRSSSGRCVQYISPGGNHPFEMLELSTAARDGDSGGPILNARGELAGVLFGAARGRTAGSYCGRVQWFLNSVSAQFDALSAPPSDTMIAHDIPAPIVDPPPATPSIDQVAIEHAPVPLNRSWEPSVETSREPSQRREMPLASIPASLAPPRADQSPEQASARRIPGDDSTEGEEPSASTAEAAPEEVPVRWSDVAGETRPEQVKNFLAALGIVSVVFHGLRIFSSLQGQSAPKRRKRPAKPRQTRRW
jgi:hypothetical protein